MKKLFLSFILITSITACSQNKNDIMQNPNITAANIAEEITKQIKHYPVERQYKYRYNNSMCYFEIFINDLPAFKDYQSAQNGSAFLINDLIFKNGKQKVSYKLSPAEGTQLADNTEFQLTLLSYDQKNKESDDVEYSKFELPKIEEKIAENYSKYKFQGSGKKTYEGSFEIDVDVPYNLQTPFENAQDLRKIDKKDLEERLVKEYNKIRDIYRSKDKDKVARLLYDKLKNQMITEYASPQKVKATWEEAKQILFNSDIEILPIEKYEMRFFGNGKLVALYADGTNPNTRGGNALVCHLKSGYGKGFLELKHLFYIPQGEKEFKVY